MGRVNLTLEDDALRGRLMQKDDLGRDVEAERLELRADGAKTKLAGTASYTSFQSQMTLTLSADGQSFTGTFLPRGETKPRAWSGKRLRATNTPATPANPTTPTSPTAPPVVTPPVTTPPVVTPPVVTPPVTTPPATTPPVVTPPVVSTPSVPATPAGASVGDGKFYPFTKFEIRLDKVTPGPEKTIHAFVTLKNLTDAEQTILGHTIQAYAEDADGMAFRASKIARASTPEAESFDNNPKVAPRGEFKVRFVLPALKGGAPLRTLIFDEDGATVAFDISNVSVPGQIALPFTNAPGATAEWKELGNLDVRFDGARPQRGSKLSEIFFTFRNPSEEPQQIFFGGGTFKVWMADADGSLQYDQGFYTVRGMNPNSMDWQPLVMPGREIRLRFLHRSPVAPTLTIEHTPSKTKQTYAIR
jgi:hypothetical protein